MKSIVKLIIIWLVSVALAGCSKREVTQPEDYQEIITAPIEEESKEEPYLWPDDPSFIIYDSYVMGVLNKSRTLVPISEADLETYKHTKGDWGFHLFKDGEYLDTVPYYGFDSQWLHDVVTEVNDPYNWLMLELEYQGECFDGLAVNDQEPLMFGAKIQLDPSAQVYQDYMAEILADHGLENEPVHIREIVRTDLEGDGVDEVLMIASNIGSPNRLKGQYSIVVLRKIIDGKVESIFLVKDIKDSLPYDSENRLLYDYGLREIVDLDHDGIYELLITETYYEGQYYLVYKFVNGEPQLVLANGFGV